MSYDFYEVSSHAQHFGSFLIAVLGFIYFSKREKTIRILVLYGLNSVVFQLANQILPYYTDEYVVINIVTNIYILTEALILLYFFYSLFEVLWAKKLVVILSIAYTILYFILSHNHWQEFLGSIRMLRDLLMISCSLLYFYFLMSDMPTTEITRYPMFWITSAFIFFFAGTFVLSLSVDYLIDVLKDDLSYLWPARNFFRFFFCLVVSYGLWLDLRLVKMNQRVKP